VELGSVRIVKILTSFEFQNDFSVADEIWFVGLGESFPSVTQL